MRRGTISLFSPDPHVRQGLASTNPLTLVCVRACPLGSPVRHLHPLGRPQARMEVVNEIRREFHRTLSPLTSDSEAKETDRETEQLSNSALLLTRMMRITAEKYCASPPNRSLSPCGTSCCTGSSPLPVRATRCLRGVMSPAPTGESMTKCPELQMGTIR